VRLPYRQRSRAVLIGTGRYADDKLPDLPVVGRTIADLAAALTDPVYGVVPENHCTVLEDQGDIRLIGRHLRSAARSAEDLLLVYFVGHGLVGGRRHELYLGLPDSEWAEPEFNSLEYDKLRSSVLDSAAATKIIILDCCFSGRVVSETMADPVTEMVGQIEVDGTYVLASAGRDQVALMLPGEDYTAFTGRFLQILRNGVPGGPELLSVDYLYRQLVMRMRAEGLSQPQKRGTSTADLLALAKNRALAAARRRDLAPGERSIDILVIDDRPDHEAGWFARHLPDHRVLSLESVSELEHFLAGKRLPNLPEPPYRPELAIFDLSLGVGQRDGLQALHVLRQNPGTRDLPAILNTIGLEDHRDLLAVLAAQLNGGAIPVARKTSTDGPAVRDLARRIAHANDVDLPWPLDKRVPGLLDVREVFWDGGDEATPVSLLDYLLDLPWKRTYWKEMARHRNHQDAALEARKRHGTLTTSTGGEATEFEARRAAQNHARFVANQFGPLAVAWALAGGHLHQLGGQLSLTSSQQEDRFPEFSSNRGAHLVAFATRYGPVLADPFVQSLPDHPIRLRPGEPRP
jgi:CheY-like chemotaxis protein